MGLLDSMVGALAGAQGGGQGGHQGGQGGLGDLLGSVLGGGGAGGGGTQAALISAVLAMLSQNGSAAGGLGALVGKLQQGGLGDVVGSWVSSGQNLPVSGLQLQDALGPDLIGQLAGKLGLSPQDAGQQLSQWLPQAVDHLTPSGRLPSAEDLGPADSLGDIGSILGRFGQR